MCKNKEYMFSQVSLILLIMRFYRPVWIFLLFRLYVVHSISVTDVHSCQRGEPFETGCRPASGTKSPFKL